MIGLSAARVHVLTRSTIVLIIVLFLASCSHSTQDGATGDFSTVHFQTMKSEFEGLTLEIIRVYTQGERLFVVAELSLSGTQWWDFKIVEGFTAKYANAFGQDIGDDLCLVGFDDDFLNGQSLSTICTLDFERPEDAADVTIQFGQVPLMVGPWPIGNRAD